MAETAPIRFAKGSAVWCQTTPVNYHDAIVLEDCVEGDAEGDAEGLGDGEEVGNPDGASVGLTVGGGQPQEVLAVDTSDTDRKPESTRHATHSVPVGSPHSHASHVASHVLLTPYSRSSHALVRVVPSTW